MIGFSKGRSIWTLVGGVAMGAGVFMFIMSLIDSGYGLIVHGLIVFVLGLSSFLIGRSKENTGHAQ